MDIAFITGSREWTDREAIECVLRGADALIVGDAKGADELALMVALAWDIIPLVYGADPKRCARLKTKHGIEPIVVADWEGGKNKGAGHIRNAAMVARAVVERDAGMHVRCYAFPLPSSVGTHNCIEALLRAKFHVDVDNAYP